MEEVEEKNHQTGKLLGISEEQKQKLKKELKKLQVIENDLKKRLDKAVVDKIEAAHEMGKQKSQTQKVVEKIGNLARKVQELEEQH